MYSDFKKDGSFGFIDIDEMDNDAIKLLDFGVEIRDKEYYFNNAKRLNYNGYLFQFTIDGEGFIEKDGIEYSLSKDMGFLINFPNKYKYYVKKSKASYWKFLYIHFSGNEIVNYYNKIIGLTNGIFRLNKHSDSIKKFLHEYSIISNSATYKKYEGAEFIYSFITSLLRDIEKPITYTPNTELIKKWLEINYSNKDALTFLSKYLNLSLPHLSRIFKKHTGSTLIDYLTKIRLQNSINLLLNSNNTVDKIALECGFSCGNYFSKVFKKN